MSQIGNDRHNWAYKHLTPEKYSLFKLLCTQEAYRLGGEGVAVGDLYDHCTAYAVDQIQIDDLEASVTRMDAGAAEYEEAMAGLELMGGTDAR